MLRILSPAGSYRKMARTVKDKKRFPFKIAIVPVEESSQKAPWIGTHRWKHKAMYNIKMKLSIQIEKASIRAKYKWYKFYFVRGYGAPGRLEFICPYSGMVASTISQEEAASLRRYWSICASKSKQILDWLDNLDVARYSAKLHTYLLRTIVISYNIREINEYKKLHPEIEAKPWQNL